MAAPPRQHVLRNAQTAHWRRNAWPVPPDSGRRPTPTDKHLPPSFAVLRERGLLGQGWQYFHVKGREDDLAVAVRLRELGIEMVAIDEDHPKPKPDGYVAGTHATVEFKTPRAATPTSAYRALRSGRRQSTRLVVNVARLAITENEAFELFAPEIARYAGSYREVLILGSGFGLLWP